MAGRSQTDWSLTLAAVVLALTTSGAARAAGPFLELDQVVFDPPFFEANGQRQEVGVSVVLRDNPGGASSLDLEEFRVFDADEDGPVRRATLRNDGSGTFIGRLPIRLPTHNFAACGVIRLQLRDRASESGIVSPVFELPSRASYVPSTSLKPNVVVGGEDELSLLIDEQRAGHVILAVNSGAQVGESDDVRIEVEGVEPPLNLPFETDCIEQPVEIDPNGTTLNIRTSGGNNRRDRVVVRVDAVADELFLTVLEKPSLRTGRALRAEALVLALDRPVADAEVEFSLGERRVVSTTDADGIARVAFSAAEVGASAVLGAVLLHTVDPVTYFVDGLEYDAAEIVVGADEQATVSLAQPGQPLKLEAGESRTIQLTVGVNVGQDDAFEVELQSEAAPDDGLDVALSEGLLRGIGPRTFAVRQTVSATQPGFYTIYTDAYLDGHDEPAATTHDEPAATTQREVEVAEADSGGRLVIYGPVSEPAILRTSELGQPVEFRAVVGGTSAPPERLFLEELEEDIGPEGAKLVPRQRLRPALRDDDRDGVYTGSFTIDGTPQERKLYRATAESGEHSETYTFEIVPRRFPLQLRPFGDPDGIVEEPVTGDRFADNQVLVRFRQHVSPALILAVVEEAFGGDSLIGFEPVLDVAQVAFENSPAEVVRGVQARLAALEEVEAVEPNHATELTTVGRASGQAAPAAAGDYPDEAALARVRAGEAWLGSGRNPRANQRRNVAVLDTAIDAEALPGQTLRPHDGCSPNSQGSHGTRVASVVAAILGGADQGAFLLPVSVLQGDAEDLFTAVICGLGYVAQHPSDARIVNLSVGFNKRHLTRSRKARLSDEVMRVIGQQFGILVVAAAGNSQGQIPVTSKLFPAAFNGRGLIAVANSTANDLPFDGAPATRRGPWVDLAAPGVEIATLEPGGRPIASSGTSFAAPLVAGAASILWSRNPAALPEEIEDMLEGSVTLISPDRQIGRGRLDVAEAIVNGSVEIAAQTAESPATWSAIAGRCSRVQAVGDDFYTAQHGSSFLRCDSNGDVARAEKQIRIPRPGLGSLEVKVAIAALVDTVPAEVDLEVRIKGQTKKYFETFAASQEQCGDFAGAGGCIDWQEAAFTLRNVARGRSTVVFKARNRGGGSVGMLLDEFSAREVP